jgi:hypothetical protein
VTKLIIVLALGLLFFSFFFRGAPYSKQRAHDVAVEKVSAVAAASSKMGSLPEDLAKVLGASALPRVNLPPPISLSSPNRFEVIISDWELALSEGGLNWSATSVDGGKIDWSDLPDATKEDFLASRENDRAFWTQGMLSTLRQAKSEKMVVIALSPKLDPLLKVLTAACRAGGAGEFAGVNLFVVSDREDILSLTEAIGNSGIIPHSSSYR